MNLNKTNPYLHILDGILWIIDKHDCRSEELTPLFIDRYSGPRENPDTSTHDYWELFVVFKGNGRITAASQTVDLKKSYACLIPPGIPHLESSNEALDALWIGLRGSLLDHFDKNGMVATSGGEIADLTERLWLRSIRPLGAIGPELDGLARVLLGSFQRHITTTETYSHGRMEDVLLYINTHYANDLNAGLLAAKFGCSESYFYRTFKHYTGQTPVAYITRVRIQNAAKLISKSTLSLKRISHMVGFNDPRYFSRIFKQITGHNPSADSLPVLSSEACR